MAYMSSIYYGYAAALLLGGIFGYAKAKSTPSLVAGVVSAILAAVAGYLAPHHHRSADGLAALVSLALIVVFARRYSATKNAMPAIPMIVISGVVLVFALADFAMRTRQPA